MSGPYHINLVTKRQCYKPMTMLVPDAYYLFIFLRVFEHVRNTQ